MDVHDQTISGIHASKQIEEDKDEFEKSLHHLGVLRRQRPKLNGGPFDELAKDAMFDDGLSYNIINSLLQDEVPVTVRKDRNNCLAVVELENYLVVMFPDYTQRQISFVVLSADIGTEVRRGNINLIWPDEDSSSDSERGLF